MRAQHGAARRPRRAAGLNPRHSSLPGKALPRRAAFASGALFDPETATLITHPGATADLSASRHVARKVAVNLPSNHLKSKLQFSTRARN
jgi:hypothetical protein